ncbi:MAG TPA: hypothetical protein VGO92_03335 [Acidimicrobiales bacterium]|nr:hypothetical protein [Acidimicrobiales bacterium]
MTLRPRTRIAAAFLLAAACGHGKPAGSALRGPDAKGNWYSVAGDAGLGQPISFGTVLTVEPGVRERVLIRSIELVGARGLDAAHVSINGPGRSFSMIGVQRGPLPELDQDVLHLPTAAVYPGDPRGVAVTFTLQRSTAGRGYATGYAVSYTAAGKRGRQVFRTGVAVCAIPGFQEGVDAPRCPTVARPRH